MDSLTGKSEIISVKETKSRLYERKEKVHNSVVIKLDLDRKIIVRNHYTVLDLLSNLGGLAVAVFIIVSISYIILQMNVFDNMMVHKLFRGDFSMKEVTYDEDTVDM